MSSFFRRSPALAAAGLFALLFVCPARAEITDLGVVGDFSVVAPRADSGESRLADEFALPGGASVDKAVALPESSIWLMVLLWFAGLGLALGWRSRKPSVSLVEERLRADLSESGS